MKKSLPIERKYARNKPTLKRAEFWFDGGQVVPGWSTGEKWNGWGVPLFDRDQIEAAMSALRATGDMDCDFHSGDILEIWPKDDRDQIEEHEAIKLDGKLYWRLDGFTWNEKPSSDFSFKVGDRVRLIRDVERYPHFIANRGATGTVTFVGEDPPSPSSGITLLVRADRKIRGAEEWDNEIEWAYDDDPRGDLEIIGTRDVRAGRHVRASGDDDTGFGRGRREPFAIPGWSVGYNDEISAHAAVRTPRGMKGRWLFVMTSPEDREPRSLDEEVTVGLYYLNEDDDWEQIAWQDFPDVSSAIKLSDEELLLIIEHALSLDQARDLLVQEFEEWEENDGVVSAMSWMETILKDAGVKDAAGHAFPEAQGAQREAIEQIRNASPRQILDYMNERSEAINE